MASVSPSDDTDLGGATIASVSEVDGVLKTKSQSVVSIVLAIHLFCISICIFSVLPTSDLGARLLTVFSPYLQFFHFDLNFMPYYLTRETLNSDTFELYGERDFIIEYLPQGADQSDANAWKRIGQQDLSGTPVRQRYLRYARSVAFYVEEDVAVSRFIRDVADYLVSERDVEPVLIRVVQHRPVPRQRYYASETRRPDPDAPEYYRTIYTARVIVNDSGRVDVMKDVPSAEAALLREGEEAAGDGASGNASEDNATEDRVPSTSNN